MAIENAGLQIQFSSNVLAARRILNALLAVEQRIQVSNNSDIPWWSINREFRCTITGVTQWLGTKE